MSALLVKEAPERLHKWLKDEAQCNRRSLNQQILICLEWCMQTYGKAQLRNPFASVHAAANNPGADPGYLHGRELALRLASKVAVSEDDAKKMKSSIRRLRSSRTREFDYGCFA